MQCFCRVQSTGTRGLATDDTNGGLVSLVGFVGLLGLAMATELGGAMHSNLASALAAGRLFSLGGKGSEGHPNSGAPCRRVFLEGST